MREILLCFEIIRIIHILWTPCNLKSRHDHRPSTYHKLSTTVNARTGPKIRTKIIRTRDRTITDRGLGNQDRPPYRNSRKLYSFYIFYLHFKWWCFGSWHWQKVSGHWISFPDIFNFCVIHGNFRFYQFRHQIF